MSGDGTALLYYISRQLNSDLDIDRVLADALHLTVEHVGAYNGSIIVFDEDGAVAHKILARIGMPSEKQKSVIAEVLSEGLAGWVVEHREGSIVRAVLSDPRWISFPDDQLIDGSAVSVPLLRSDRVIGVITLRHPERDLFTQAHLDLLCSIADQAAMAIENARLFHSVQTERAKMEAIINGAGDGILVTDQQGKMLLMNALARQAFNVAADDPLRDQSLTDLIPNQAMEELWEHRENSAYPSTSQVSFPDGRTFLANLAGIPNVGYILVMQDVTDLRALNQMKTEFVSSISHDLRSPLQLIYTYAGMVGDAGPLNQQQGKFVDGINRSVEKMAELINQLLDLAKIEAGVDMDLEPCHLEHIIAIVTQRFKGVAQETGLTLESKIAPNLPAILVNPRRLDQVISNLVDNAIKYTPEGTITIQADADEKQITISVVDSGIGLMPQEQKGLFSKFYRAQNKLTREIEGTGLGLAIARSIIEQHDGRIWVQSTWNRGSTFAFSLPIRKRDRE